MVKTRREEDLKAKVADVLSRASEMGALIEEVQDLVYPNQKYYRVCLPYAGGCFVIDPKHLSASIVAANVCLQNAERMGMRQVDTKDYNANRSEVVANMLGLSVEAGR